MKKSLISEISYKYKKNIGLNELYFQVIMNWSVSHTHISIQTVARKFEFPVLLLHNFLPICVTAQSLMSSSAAACLKLGWKRI